MSGEKKEGDAAAENATLRAELAMLRGRLNSARQANIGATLTESRPASYLTSKKESGNSEGGPADLKAHLSIVVLGASGDLAVKKTYPALFALYRHKLMPTRFTIVGYARSKIEHDEFLKKISAKFGDKWPKQMKDDFLSHCWYVSGQYDSAEDFKGLSGELEKKELAAFNLKADQKTDHALNRIFYMAIPPNAFVPAAKSIHSSAMAQRGWNRIVVEKPFGRDLESSEELGKELSALFTEDQLFRIDHYLGKEMVQNLQVLRFANRVFEPLWNRDHINCVQISFKEDFGVIGRGGYFDSFGIIRDVMQNHLLQMLSILAMEPPLSLSAEDVRDEKVKLLRSIAPITVEDTVIGQYTADPKGKEPGYLDDEEVPNDSVTPTYAASVLHINNTRWMGIPFIMRCGKALNEKKADIRVQFKYPVNTLFGDLSPNELVLRVGPDEAVYMKLTTKSPGLDGGNEHTELDLTYKHRFQEQMEDLPDAYERLVLDVIRGDHSLFVRSDELTAAWRIFTPLLHKIEKDRALKPIKYEFGSRGPAEADQLVQRYGFIHTDKYKWSDRQKHLNASPSPSVAAKTLAKHEPPILSEFVQLIEDGCDDVKKLAALYTSDGQVESAAHGTQSPTDWYKAIMPTLKSFKFQAKSKLIDPTKPNQAAVVFEAQGEDKGKPMQLTTVDMIEMSDDGKKIKRLRVFTEGPKPVSKL